MNSSSANPRHLLWSLFCVLGGVISQAMSWQTILSSETIASNMLSAGRWRSTVSFLGGRMSHGDSGAWLAEVDFLPLAFVWLVVAAVSGLVAGVLVRRTTRASWSDSLTQAGFAFGWWCLMGVWELSRLLAFGIGFESLERLLLVSPHFWMSVALAGWMTQPFVRTACPAISPRPHRPISTAVILALLIATYVSVFTAMNWQLWFNLRIPHGDSAMYEEHLWNLTHGKGFRSYLDQGLFLGEHIQVVHLLLLPLHWLWPSHLLLELCESTALALGAIPVFRMARRSTGSDRAGLLLAGAYLLYFPLHFLDIEVDLKTFRPESFCVPFFLFAFDQLEQGRLRRMVVLLLFALSAKEDYSIIIAPLGVWIAVRAWLSWKAENGKRTADGDISPVFRFPHSAFWSAFILGLCLALFGAIYLVVATRVVIPWFRGGAELHYVKYFSKFGDSIEQIVWNMLTKPGLLFGELITVKTVMYGVSMLLPVGFVSLLSPSRLAVGLPLFGILCLNELAPDPQHHFHAPLVPVVFWAAAVGVSRAGTVANKLDSFFTPSPPQPISPSSSWNADSFARQFVWTSAFASSLFLSMSPAGISFWDSHSSLSLWRLYAHDPRADQFPKVFAQIPQTARVASTDFVHPRFTHHERAYDYSHYRRRVAGYEDRIPDDTDFIVIDARHPYSEIQSPDQVRELRQEPDHWELLPDETDGYFIVLRRSRAAKP